MNAIDKVFHLLDQFTDEKPQWGVRELSARIGLSPNLTHWYLKNLERQRIVRKDPQADKYELGYRLFELANRNSKWAAIRRISYPILRQLGAETKGTAVLRVMDGEEILCLAAVESPSSLRVHHSEGARAPCNFGCVGKLLMAYMDEKQAEHLVLRGRVRRFTERTIVDLAALRKEWTKIRMRGWAYSSGEALRGARALAAPVRDPSGAVCAGIGLTFPAISLPNSRVKDVAREVVGAANQISLQLGWAPSSRGQTRKSR